MTIYLCAPYADDIPHNIRAVKRIARRMADMGHTVIAPQLALSYLDEATERDKALDQGLKLLELADELWICSDFVSKGMMGEIKHVKDMQRKGSKIKIRTVRV